MNLPRSSHLAAEVPAPHGKARFPLYLQILVGLVLGTLVGLAMGPSAEVLEWPAKIILRILGALAPPLILVAVVDALLKAEFHGRTGLRLAWLLITNTLAAICIGLLVANVVRPGIGAKLGLPSAAPKASTDLGSSLFDNIPSSLLSPLVEGKVIGVVMIAVAVGVAGRTLGQKENALLRQLCTLGMQLLIRLLSWVLALVPLAVFSKVASVIGSNGFQPLFALGWFVAAVLIALVLQSAFYLTRIRLGSWVKLSDLFRSLRDALVMSFSTASSTITMPVTYQSLLGLGLRERSASLGALVGSNFNNDGTALYEAMAALFVAQMLGIDLSLWDQCLVIVTSVIASVGAAGIPEAGLVTMTLVFTAVRLPTEAIALLLTVDWFLDRCRTTINVLGDVTVACVLDGKEQEK